MSKMSLGNVTRGRVQKPYRILIYGVEGVGKSSFAAGAPGAIFVSSEDGTSHLDVARFPEVDNWEDTFAAVESLSGQHDYQTVAFDTVDWLEPLCIAHVLHVNGWSTIEKLARGEGYNAVKEEWRRLLGALEKLQTERRMNVIMIGHAKIRKHKHPELDEFDRFELSIMPGSAKLMREWAEHVLFADYETLTYKENDDKRVRTIGEGARYIHTSWRPAYDAKSRGNEAPLPEKIPLSWADFDSAVKASGNPDAVRTEIVSLLASADDDLRKKVEETMKGADPARLAQILNRLKAKLAA